MFSIGFTSTRAGRGCRPGSRRWSASCASAERAGRTMNQALVDQIANAVLYEGYLLYPYRPSVKNRQRWTFGGLYPPRTAAHRRVPTPGPCRRNVWSGAAAGDAADGLGPVPAARRAPGRRVRRAAGTTGRGRWVPPFRLSSRSRSGTTSYHSWQEAVEREIALGELRPRRPRRSARGCEFDFAAGRELEPLRGAGGTIVGVIVREQQADRRRRRALAPRSSETGFSG